MPKINESRFACDYGSGARLQLGVNGGHVVIAIDEEGKRHSIALTPDTLELLGERLLKLAAQYRAHLDFESRKHLDCKAGA